MKTILEIILFLSVVIGSIGEPCMNGASYNRKYHKCYYFFVISSTYRDAELICGSIHARLVTFHSLDEQTFVQRQAVRKFIGGDYWIGLADYLASGEFTWADGFRGQFFNWAPNFPRNISHDLCVGVRLYSGMWYNAGCNMSEKHVVCESPPKLQSDNFKKGNWTYLANTNSWYQIITWNTDNSWIVADELCRTRDGHLASIHSHDENQHIYGLGLVNYCTGIHIGLRSYVKNIHSFQWSDETYVDYSNWGTRPFNILSYKYCAYMDLTSAGGYWYNEKCSGSSLCAVCKRSADSFEFGAQHAGSWKNTTESRNSFFF